MAAIQTIDINPPPPHGKELPSKSCDAVAVVGLAHECKDGAYPTRDSDYEGKPTEEELATLRRVPGDIPAVAYLLCAVEFCERASFIGCAQLWTNYINRPLPKGGNGYGAVAPDSTTSIQGALGMGEQIANATTQSFSLISFCLPLVTGYLADTKFGRYSMMFWGVILCGVAHVLIVAGGARELIENGTAKIPFFLGVYILAVGSAMFKPVVTPLLLDQMSSHVPTIKTLPSGERVIQDPEHSTERIMMWFYIFTNIGGFTSTATSYAAKYVGWWLAFLLPLLLYLPLPMLLIWLKPRLVLHKPGGSDLPNVLRAIGHCLSGGGIFRIGRRGWWNPAKPSVRAERGLSPETRYTDAFVVDVQRTMQATGMFCFFPIQYWNDNGIGNAPNYLSTMLTSDGVPNDVIGNFNCISIIVMGPILNYLVYPMLCKAKVKYGPVARITTGFFISTLSGIAYTILCYKAYQTSPCGWYGSTDPRCVDNDLFSPISLWWETVPFALGGFSELFINVPAYGIAYSRAPVNMRGLVSAIYLFTTGFANIVNLATSAVIVDPYLVWDFLVPAAIGAVVTVSFWFIFKHIDKEAYVLSTSSPVKGEVAVEDPEATAQRKI
ncbi:hypothetical protein E4U13_007171 [Claviceps humidiphila]|uniref:Peptide transporter PTR2 n=1 Tax=Claviceps humidiphila TaxID=1294629 RepID=A0A9P7PVY1_9HYPO|nr:hypothetical protein E4U13_007171 [Claviceps humidiphila]